MSDLKYQVWSVESQRWADVAELPEPGDIFRVLPTDPDASYTFDPSPKRALPPEPGAGGVLHFCFEKLSGFAPMCRPENRPPDGSGRVYDIRPDAAKGERFGGGCRVLDSAGNRILGVQRVVFETDADEGMAEVTAIRKTPTGELLIANGRAVKETARGWVRVVPRPGPAGADEPRVVDVTKVESA